MSLGRSSLNKAFQMEVAPMVGKLSELQHKRLGVDGNKIIQLINECIIKEEPFAALSTSIPFPLYNVATHIATISTKVKLEVVFNGVMLKRPPQDPQSKKVNALLNFTGRVDDAISRLDPMRHQSLLEEVSPTLGEDGEDYIFTYLKLFDKSHENPTQNEMTVTRSPYWAWAQLASYLDVSQKYLDEVYGCLELLAFDNVQRVITYVDVETNEFHYYTKDQLVNFVKSKTIPSLKMQASDLPAIVAMYSNHKLFNEVMSSDFNNVAQLDRCSAGKLIDRSNPGSRYLARAVEFCPIMSLKGEIKALSELRNISCPALGDLFGERLPAVFYYAVMTGLLNPNTLGAVATLQVVDSRPPVDTVEYREISERIIPLRAQIFHQLVIKLEEIRGGRPWVNASQSMTWIRRYNTGTGRQVPLNSPPPITLDEWDTRSFAQPQAYFSSVAKLADKACKTADYLTANSAFVSILLKSMDFMGYFTHASQQPEQHDVSGPSVYSLAMEYCTTETLSEYAVLLIELLRTNTLTGLPLKLTTNNNQNARPEAEEILFASRLLSIIPLRLKKSWTGPVNADLAAFSSMARMLQRSLRALTEVIATSTLVKTRSEQTTPAGPPTVSATEFASKIQPNLPFSTPLMSCTGIVIAHAMSRPITLAALNNTFPDCMNLQEDLSTIFGFWWFAEGILRKMCEEEPAHMAQMELFYRANTRLSAAAAQLSPEFSYLTKLPRY